MAIAACCVNPADGMAWVAETERASTWEELKYEPKWATLSIKWAEVLKSTCKSDLTRDIRNIERKLLNSNGYLNGRQIYWMILQRVKRSDTVGRLCNFHDLVNVHLIQDNIQGFVTKWDSILLKMGDNIPDTNMRLDMFESEIKKSEKFYLSFKFYRNKIQMEGHIPSYQELYQLVTRHLEQAIMDKNNSRPGTGPSYNAQPAAGAEWARGMCRKYWDTGKCADQPNGRCSYSHNNISPQAKSSEGRNRQGKGRSQTKGGGKRQESNKSQGSGGRGGRQNNDRSGRQGGTGRQKQNDRSQSRVCSPSPSGKRPLTGRSPSGDSDRQPCHDYCTQG